MYRIGDRRFMNIQELRAYIEAGNRFDNDSDRRSAISLLLKQNAVDLAYVVFEQYTASLDLFEYSYIGDVFFSIFASTEMPGTEETAGFLITALSKAENLDEPVGNETLMQYFLAQGASPVFVQCLINAGCDLNHQKWDQSTYLHQIIKTTWHIISEETKLTNFYLLIEGGADIHRKNMDGETPLITAVKKNEWGYVKLLMDRGADPGEPDKDGCTAFYYVIHYGERVVIYDELCKHASPDFEIKNHYGETYFIAFMKKMTGREDEMQLLPKLLEAGASFSPTITGHWGEMLSGLGYLAGKNIEVLKLVLDNNYVNINEKDNEGNTLLHKVCSGTASGSEAAKDVYRKVKLLLEAGADANATNDKDETPVMLAMQDDAKAKTVELLLNRK